MDAYFEASLTNPTVYGTTPNQTGIARENVNKILSTTAASLSLVGTLIIFATFWMWPDLRTNSRRMIVFISVGDFLVAGADIVGQWGLGQGQGCRIQAAIGIIGILPSFFWTVYLSLYFYLTICRRISLESEERFMTFFHVTAWGIPLTIAVIAYAMKGVGYSGDVGSSGWCWISDDQDWWKMVLWMCISGKGWEISAYIAITVFYVLVKLQIRKQILSIALTLYCTISNEVKGNRGAGAREKRRGKREERGRKAGFLGGGNREKQVKFRNISWRIKFL